MQALKIGEPYDPTFPLPYPERGVYSFDTGGHRLVLFFANPTNKEVRQITRAKARFAFAVDGPNIFFLYRFGEESAWSDAPFNWHRVPEGARALPSTPYGAHAPLTVVLVDAMSGLIKSWRLLTFSAEFTREIEAAILCQADDLPLSVKDLDKAVARTYDRYPMPKDLLAESIARTSGGA